MKVYTRTGDAGRTSLFSGGRVGKDDARIEAYGAADELNSVLGVLLCEPLPETAERVVKEIQSSLFAIGAVLADPEGKIEHAPESWDAASIEGWIDDMDDALPDLRAFILPGGTRGAALAHLARTVCRRCERRVFALANQDAELPEGLLPYLNRLSDALFVLGRFLNQQADVPDQEWHATAPTRE
jgi:cob(I)alamin adenosyltransferase